MRFFNGTYPTLTFLPQYFFILKIPDMTYADYTIASAISKIYFMRDNFNLSISFSKASFQILFYFLEINIAIFYLILNIINKRNYSFSLGFKK